MRPHLLFGPIPGVLADLLALRPPYSDLVEVSRARQCAPAASAPGARQSLGFSYPFSAVSSGRPRFREYWAISRRPYGPRTRSPPGAPAIRGPSKPFPASGVLGHPLFIGFSPPFSGRSFLRPCLSSFRELSGRYSARNPVVFRPFSAKPDFSAAAPSRASLRSPSFLRALASFCRPSHPVGPDPGSFGRSLGGHMAPVLGVSRAPRALRPCGLPATPSFLRVFAPFFGRDFLLGRFRQYWLIYSPCGPRTRPSGPI